MLYSLCVCVCVCGAECDEEDTMMRCYCVRLVVLLRAFVVHEFLIVGVGLAMFFQSFTIGLLAGC